MVKVGQRIPVPDRPAGDKTLVLALQKGCENCEMDMPIYQTLAATRKVLDGSVSVVVLLPPGSTPDYGEAMQRWMVDNKLPGTLRIAAKFPVEATPTVMLLDRDSCVEKVWIGSLKARGNANSLLEELR